MARCARQARGLTPLPAVAWAVARQLGHDARLTLTTYGHVIDELDEAPRLPAEDAIRAAARARVHVVCMPTTRMNSRAESTKPASRSSKRSTG